MNRRSLNILVSLLLLATFSNTWAFTWKDLWVTKNCQAQRLMDSGEFAKAQNTFDDPAWKAAAAYQAKHYAEAAAGYESLTNNTNNTDIYYNQGNALAHNGKLEDAIKAYDKALALSPLNHDAKHNRKIVAKLLEKQKKENQQKKNNHTNNNKQDQQNTSKQKKSNNKQNKPNKTKQDAKPHKKPSSSPAEREKQQAKKQWLRLVPDDPGGLMREKFLRDYLRGK